MKDWITYVAIIEDKLNDAEETLDDEELRYLAEQLIKIISGRFFSPHPISVRTRWEEQEGE